MDWFYDGDILFWMFGSFLLLELIIIITNLVLLRRSKTCLNCKHYYGQDCFVLQINNNKKITKYINRTQHYCDIQVSEYPEHTKSELSDLIACEAHTYKLIPRML